jgi:hypothetical protein
VGETLVYKVSIAANELGIIITAYVVGAVGAGIVTTAVVPNELV